MKTWTILTRRILTVTLPACVLAAWAQLAPAQTAFTFQGQLFDTGLPAADGLYDLQFTLFDAAIGGTVLGGPLAKPGTQLTDGLFTVTLDYGSAPFEGSSLWIEVAVRSQGADMVC